MDRVSRAQTGRCLTISLSNWHLTVLRTVGSPAVYLAELCPSQMGPSAVGHKSRSRTWPVISSNPVSGQLPNCRPSVRNIVVHLPQAGSGTKWHELPDSVRGDGPATWSRLF